MPQVRRNRKYPDPMSVESILAADALTNGRNGDDKHQKKPLSSKIPPPPPRPVGPDGKPVPPQFITKGGTVDKRYRLDGDTIRARRKKAKEAGVTRQDRVAQLLSGRHWKFIREGRSAEGVKSITGARLRTYMVLEDMETGEQVMCGKGECEKYAHITPPVRRSAQDRLAFASYFDNNGVDASPIPSSFVNASESADDDDEELDDEEPEDDDTSLDLSFLNEK